jgi:hypothetical protein
VLNNALGHKLFADLFACVDGIRQDSLADVREKQCFAEPPAPMIEFISDHTITSLFIGGFQQTLRRHPGDKLFEPQVARRALFLRAKAVAAT